MPVLCTTKLMLESGKKGLLFNMFNVNVVDSDLICLDFHYTSQQLYIRLYIENVYENVYTHI